MNVENLKGIISDIELVEKEKATLSDNLREIFESAKENGFNVKAIKQIVKMRKLERSQLEMLEDAVDKYRVIIGL